jgi:hypothetical protein
VEAALMMVSVFAFVGFVLALVAAHLRANIRHRTEVQKALLAKFSSPQELTDFLNSDAGKLLLHGAKEDVAHGWRPPPPRTVSEQIGIAIGWGVLVLSVGIAILVVDGLTLPAAVFTALGTGMLFNALLRLALAKRRNGTLTDWGS